MNEECLNSKYSIRLSIRHPDIDPNEITRTLGMEPDIAWTPGLPKVTSHGKILPTKAKSTYWNYDKIVEDDPKFSVTLKKIVLNLEKHRDFLKGIIQTYGDIEIDIQFYGQANIGDIIDWDVLEKMARLKINLGIEVFPDWN